MKQTYFLKVDIRGRVRVCLETLTSLDIKGKYIVDIGSSIGWLEEQLLKYHPKKLVGVEPNRQAIAYSKKKVKEAVFINSSAAKIPVKSKAADIAVMFDVLEHVPKKHELKALTEAARILKKGGKLVLSTPNSHFLMNLLDLAWYFGHRHYERNYLKGLVRKAGFKIDKFEVRGGIWFAVYLVWHYVMKWIFGKPLAVNEYMLRKDDDQFSKKSGIYTIFLIATKI